MAYTHLTREQRYQIYALKQTGHIQSVMAKIIGVSESTISRELRRNKGLRGYRPKQAHDKSIERQQKKVSTRISLNTWQTVDRLLCEDWSPEQISGWLKENSSISISHESIYQYILKDKRSSGDLYLHLRCKRKRKKRYGSNPRTRGQIPNRVSIEERPVIVDEKSRYGDWELDTIIGKNHKQAIVTITERKSKLTLIRKVKRKTADLVGQAVIDLLKPLKELVHTITADNGKEFTNHSKIAKALKADIYFAHPYASWERGLNENTNGLIRQYFPKQMMFEDIVSGDKEMVMNRLNNRPRKKLDFKTPNQVLFNINPNLALDI